jgi:DNA-binding beta-propeller fold protein YncE
MRGGPARPASTRVLAAAVLGIALGHGSAGAQTPGHQREGTVLLPNGWRIAPAGRHILVGDLPLAMLESPDGRHLVVTNNGHAKPTLTVVDLQRLQIKSRLTLDHAWLGLAWHPDGKRLYSSGAGGSTVDEITYNAGTLSRGDSFRLAQPSPESFVGGIAVTPDGARLFAVQVLGQTLSMIDLRAGGVARTIALPAEPYSCLVSADGRTLFVSLWGGSKVLLFDAATLEPRGEIAVGEHPNAMVLSRDGSRLFVACANTNAVWAVDLAAGAAREQIGIALFPGAPPGSTPNALDLSPDGETLVVANADNNSVAVVDVGKPGQSEVEGFIPTG